MNGHGRQEAEGEDEEKDDDKGEGDKGGEELLIGGRWRTARQLHQPRQ